MKCCCKKNNVEPITGFQPKVAEGPRKCTDCICIILFLVFWVGMIVCAVIGVRNGDPSKYFFFFFF